MGGVVEYSSSCLNADLTHSKGSSEAMRSDGYLRRAFDDLRAAVAAVSSSPPPSTAADDDAVSGAMEWTIEEERGGRQLPG